MKPSIITIGNGGYNIAADCIESGIFSDYKLIVCDSDADDLKRNSESADCSFLLDSSVDKFFLIDNPQIKPIVDEVTDRLFIFAALGGMATQINLPLLIGAMNAPRRFIWSVITMPSDYEGKEVMRRASHTRLRLWACTDMFLVQNNNKLSQFLNSLSRS